ncbi:hypothetical protein [Halolamina sp. C58]|uniref:hypothetical protein n=1 Tax=Halolamina sp. C58 TaxID=3421640 RepID=UPI003EBA2CD7
MAEHHIPKGVSLDTLKEILAGWTKAGADEEPQYTSAVEERTSVSDAVGRQTRFLEELGVLEPHRQKHRLTGAGAALADALAAGDDERAREEARELLADWPLTDELRGVLAENPTDEEMLLPILADLTEQDIDAARVEPGLSTLLDAYEWAGLLDRDDEGRYRLPVTDSESGENGESDEAEAETVPGPDEAADSGAERAGGTGAAAEEATGTTDAAAEGGDEPVEGKPESTAEPAAEAPESEEPPESIQRAIEEIAETAEAAKAAAEEAKAAAEEAKAAAAADAGEGGDSASTDSAAASQPHTLSLSVDIDADSDELEAIVRGVKQGLQEESGEVDG